MSRVAGVRYSAPSVRDALRMAWVYILVCSNGAFYTGSTVQPLEARIWQHNEGLGANFTRRHRPVRLVYFEEFARVDEAFAREKQIQGWNRSKKLALIHGAGTALPALARGRSRIPDGAVATTS